MTNSKLLVPNYISKEEAFSFAEWLALNCEYDSYPPTCWSRNDDIFDKQYTTEELYKIYKSEKNESTE